VNERERHSEEVVAGGEVSYSSKTLELKEGAGRDLNSRAGWKWGLLGLNFLQLDARQLDTLVWSLWASERQVHMPGHNRAEIDY
jgi:hypothetical protein